MQPLWMLDLSGALLCETDRILECVCVYFRDADRSPWSGPVRLNEVPLVSRHQVILHGFYEEIFAGVVVLYQSFFLNNLRTENTRQRGVTTCIFFCFNGSDLITGNP